MLKLKPLDSLDSFQDKRNPKHEDIEALEHEIQALLDPTLDTDCPDEFVHKSCVECYKFPSISLMHGLFAKSDSKETVEERKKDHVLRRSVQFWLF